MVQNQTPENVIFDHFLLILVEYRLAQPVSSATSFVRPAFVHRDQHVSQEVGRESGVLWDQRGMPVPLLTLAACCPWRPFPHYGRLRIP